MAGGGGEDISLLCISGASRESGQRTECKMGSSE